MLCALLHVKLYLRTVQLSYVCHTYNYHVLYAYVAKSCLCIISCPCICTVLVHTVDIIFCLRDHKLIIVINFVLLWLAWLQVSNVLISFASTCYRLGTAMPTVTTKLNLCWWGRKTLLTHSLTASIVV